jgi:hypothetical protein
MPAHRQRSVAAMAKKAIETRRWISQLQRDARDLLARLDE